MNFESATEIERKREEIRKARQIYLEKAKEKYEKEERKKEIAKKKGDDNWMLASIDQRIKHEEQSLKKSKKKKKEKKKKKQKKKKKDSSSSSDSESEDERDKKKSKKKKKRKKSSCSSDSDEEPAWIEKSQPAQTVDTSTTAVKGPKLERDSWMQAPVDLFPTITRQDLINRKTKEKDELDKQRELMNKPGTHAKELNPYWKDGGTGLPEDQKKSENKDKPVSTGIGDAGLSWLRKSYQRCVEQAKEEGRPLEELAAERWGSLEKIQEMIRNAEATVYGEPKSRSQSDRPRNRFMKPTESDNSARKYDKHRHARSPSRSPSRQSKNERSRTPDRYKHRSRSRDRGDSSRSKYSNKSRRSKSRSLSRDRKRSRSRDRNRRRSRSNSIDRYRRRSRERSRSRDRNRSSGSSSMKGRFMKPGEIQESGYKGSRSESSRNNAPAWKKKEFQKPADPDDGIDKSAAQRDGRSYREEKNERKKRRSPSSSSSSSDSSSSSSDEDSDRGQRSRSKQDERPKSPVRILSEKEMNDLGAKIVKAEIMGNEEQAAKLKAQLEAAREAKKNAPAIPQGQSQKREDDDDFVTLTRTDRSGLARPVPDSQYPAESGGKRRRKKQKVETHTGKEGERTRYFDDDDKFDLKTLVEREKLGTAEDQNQMFARLAGRAAQKTNDDFQVDDVFISNANRKQSESIQEQRDRAAAIHEHKKMAASLEKCRFCFGTVPKHLIIAIGTKVYLCLPNNKSLTEGHCLIVPMQHVASGTTVDEDVWSEIQVFRRTLTKMFADRDEDVVFMETCMKLKQFPHMCIECVPMDKEVGDLAPIYFKKAIQESESEWSQNKKVVDLSQKDIRHSVPKGFPYFAVDFGNQGGFAHVIEDEFRFPYYFGKVSFCYR
ncbi:CWF19-like protein 2 [Mercenaria mercenaria]|uniref:CWF19-like protein 2 n=1 Tax=Mercenaria mercenaria TaxID=6596 RepID=UPI00234F618A|nr:CWF19-like protein 2 [Mercenaria mercenaria]